MNPQRLRQIAILVDSLDTAAVDRLLDQLPESQQQLVRDAVMALEPIDAAERQQVLAEFRQGFAATPRAGMTTGVQAGSESRAAVGLTSDTARAATYRPPSRVGPAPTYSSGPNAPRSAGTSAGSAVADTPAISNFGRDSALAADTAAQTARGLPIDSQRTTNPTWTAERPATQPAGLDLVETLEKIDLESLAEVVLRESPQVLAVVLALLSPLKSAQLLEVCPNDLQAAALARLRDLRELDDEVIHFLQQELYAVVRQRLKLRGRQRTGPAALAEILVAAQQLRNPTVAQTLQTQLRDPTRDPMRDPVRESVAVATPPPAAFRHGPRVGTEPTSQPMVTPATAAQSADERLISPEANRVDSLADVEVRCDFKDLVHCDPPSLQALLATAKPKLTLMALKGAPPALLDRVLKMLPRAEAKEVQFRIQNLGPTRVQDIQQAQTYLLRLASLLEDAGRFRRPSPRSAMSRRAA